MDMVKKLLFATCLLMAISVWAMGQASDTSYLVTMRFDPDKAAYAGDVFCVVESKQSRDTIVLDSRCVVFRDNLPTLRISVFVRPHGDSAFYKLRSIEAFNRDTSLPLPDAHALNKVLFTENNKGMIFLAPLRINGILELQRKACLQINVKKRWSVPVNCCCRAYVYREKPFDREIRHTQEIKDFLFRSPWSFYILED